MRSFRCDRVRTIDFEQTLTIGRQGLHVAEPSVRDALALAPEYKNDAYCDQLLLDQFGASKVDSVDFSNYEGASIIYDMNLPVPEHFSDQYDTVIDGGCLEHIFNVPQALLNCSAFCKPGGQILHMLPANNCCGHGFWQFSPELFFSLYSKTNGYSETEVFLADLSKPSKWFRVRPPVCGERVNVHSASEAYVLVRTVLGEGRFSHSGASTLRLPRRAWFTRSGLRPACVVVIHSTGSEGALSPDAAPASVAPGLA